MNTNFVKISSMQKKRMQNMPKLMKQDNLLMSIVEFL